MSEDLPPSNSAAISEAIRIADELLGVRIDEKGGEYYYDEVEEKRWILGDGGDDGNCDECEAAADEGWVDMDFTYAFDMGDVDGPPGHPHDTCELENRTRRQRVYV